MPWLKKDTLVIFTQPFKITGHCITFSFKVLSMRSAVIDYTVGSKKFVGYAAYPAAEAYPAVIVAHAWGGRDSFAENIADRLAELGYLGFALDMYGDGKKGDSIEENSALMQPLIDDREELAARVIAAHTAVSGLPGVIKPKIAICGYCFGGLVALDLARSGSSLCGSASFHGFLHGSDHFTSDISAKILAMHGMQDPMVGEDQISSFCAEMTQKHVDWQLHVYGNAMHAFTNRQANDPAFGTVYSSDADRRSWQLLTDFLREVFADK